MAKNSRGQKRAWPPKFFPKGFGRTTFFGGSTYLLELIETLKPFVRIFSQMTPVYEDSSLTIYKKKKPLL